MEIETPGKTPKRESLGRHTVESYAVSKWLVRSPVFEMRVGTIFDLETEAEVINFMSAELLETFQAHWLLRGVITGLFTVELFDLFYLKLQVDWKLF